MARLNFFGTAGCPYCGSAAPYNHHACPNDPKIHSPKVAAHITSKPYSPGGIITYYCAKCDATYARRDMDPCQVLRYQDSGEPRLFTGTLQGYRHFALASTGTLATTTNPRGTKTFRVTSPSQSYAPGWTDGENIAICDNFANADVPNSLGVTQYSQIQDRMDELERMLSQPIRATVEWEDVEITTFSDPNPVFLRMPKRRRTMEEVAGWELELANLQRWVREYERYQKNKHRMKNCTCGFYVGYHPDGDFYRRQLDTAGLGRICLHAVVECYGKIVLGTKGFRAQKLKIVAIAPYRRTVGMQLEPIGDDPYDSWLESQAITYYPFPAPIPDMARAVKAQMPGVRWFDMHEEMLAAYPEPDRTGLVQDNHTDYGMGQGH